MDDRRLEEEHRWYRIYSTLGTPRIYESKFASDEVRITLDDLRAQWRWWHDGERIQFAKAFSFKRLLDKEDIRVLNFLTRQNKSEICASVALPAAKWLDNKTSIRFLERCIEAFPRDRANFLQAFWFITSGDSTKLLLRIFQETQQTVTESPDDEKSIVEFLYCSTALFKALRTSIYSDKIILFLNHTSASVRTNAYLCARELGLAESSP